MSLDDPLIEIRSDHFTFSSSPRRDDIVASNAGTADISIPGSKCCSSETMVHYSLVIYVGVIAYMAGFLTCLYIWHV